MPDDGGWNYGANLDYMKEISKYWVEKPTKEMSGLTPEEEQKIMDDLGRFEKS